MTQSKTPPPAPPLAAPIGLWRALRAFLTTLISLFGAPEEIAALGALRREEHALMLPWLRAGEAFLRRLLFIEALALCGASPRANTSSGPRTPQTRQLLGFHGDKPEEWRVSFRVLASARGAHGRARRSRRERIELAPAFQSAWMHTPSRAAPARSSAPRLGTPRREAAALPRMRLPSAWPLAERLEAMLRAFNDPQPHAHRLARALQRNGERAARLLRPQPDRLAQLFGERDFTRCEKIARRRHRRLKPTSPDTG
ncbi:MAG: hypothetical protein ACREH4_08305 [Vitreimonas sp.]